MKFEQIVMGKAFKVKQWENKEGRKWQTFSFTYGKKDNEGGWTNTYMNVTLFLSEENFTEINEGEMIKLSGKFEPNFYQKKDGTFVETIGFVGFEILDREGQKEEVVDFDKLSDEDLDLGVDLDDDIFGDTKDEEDCPF